MQTEMYDKEDMKGIINSMPQQIKEAYNIHTNVSLRGEITKIIMCGMGGSSISGMILQNYLNLSVPIILVQNYDLPEYVDKNSLVFIASYSGNTEESVSCYREARRKQLNIVVITTGGKLNEFCQKDFTPLILIPKGLQPRNAVAYLFFPIIRVLENSGLIANKSDEIKKVIANLESNKESFNKTAKEIAEKLYGKLPVVYSSDRFYSAAYRLKCELNENTKIPAFCHKFPEMNHNELNGYVNYSKLNMNVPIHIIMLKDEQDHKRVLKRMDITKKFIKELSNEKITFTEIHIKGDCLLTKLFSTIYIGDLISYYLALRYGIDPTPVEIIERFKKEMGSYL